MSTETEGRTILPGDNNPPDELDYDNSTPNEIAADLRAGIREADERDAAMVEVQRGVDVYKLALGRKFIRARDVIKALDGDQKVSWKKYCEQNGNFYETAKVYIRIAEAGTDEECLLKAAQIREKNTELKKAARAVAKARKDAAAAAKAAREAQQADAKARGEPDPYPEPETMRPTIEAMREYWTRSNAGEIWTSLADTERAAFVDEIAPRKAASKEARQTALAALVPPASTKGALYRKNIIAAMDAFVAAGGTDAEFGAILREPEAMKRQTDSEAVRRAFGENFERGEAEETAPTEGVA